MRIEYHQKDKYVSLYSDNKLDYYGIIPYVHEIRQSKYDKKRYSLYGEEGIIHLLARLYGNLKVV